MAMLIRPVATHDLPHMLALAHKTGVGFTSLPSNEAQLAQRILRAQETFADHLPRAEQGFVFVLEDTSHGVIAGICGIEVALGLREPWYNYRVGTMVHASRALGIYSRHDTLFLSNDHTGHSELCSLFLDPAYRRDRNGSLLSKSRLLFMAQFPRYFAPVLIAEMRGASDDAGRSPFWDSLGRHFFSLEFAHADYLTGVGEKSFLAELMPKYPIYTDFLSEEARAVIGKVHPHTRPALQMLRSEGLHYAGYVDIFDAGPSLQAEVTDIRAIRDSMLFPIKIERVAPRGETISWLVSNTQCAEFRALLVTAPVRAESPFILTPAQAHALHVEPGQVIRAVTLAAQEWVS